MKIGGAGCGLIDYLYREVDFSSEAFRRFCSQTAGDGGLKPGGLVFAEDLEKFAGLPFSRILQTITGGEAPDGANVGGPALVALIHCAQLLSPHNIDVAYYGARGDDSPGRKVFETASQTPLHVDGLRIKPDYPTPSTTVLSDPNALGGKGERTFINTIGAAACLTEEDLDQGFFQSDMVLFGGTALTPKLHDNLLVLLRRARQSGAVNVVSTVYDFRNQQKAPEKPWPLGESEETYRYIDLLIVDQEEALRLSGHPSVKAAAKQFMDWGTGAFIITQGAESILFQAREGVFEEMPLTELEVCKAVDRDLDDCPEKAGDTTGCGDNFVGGALAALAMRLQRGVKPDLPTVCAWGTASGGLARFYLGGTYIEKHAGEKLEQVRHYVDAYAEQVKDQALIRE